MNRVAAPDIRNRSVNRHGFDRNMSGSINALAWLDFTCQSHVT
jgi:hypothetical protein